MNLWLVGRVLDTDSWEFLGIFDTEEKAVTACYDSLCFIGPCILNEFLEKDIIEWPNAYYPIEDNYDYI